MPDPRTVKRALRALATDTTLRERDVIDQAATAITDVERAADFADRHGTDRLERAVARATHCGDREYARRGQRALAAFERLRRVA